MYSEIKKAELNQFAKEIRIQTLEELASRGFGHLGGAMSIVEILTVLYGDVMNYDPKNPKMEGRDQLVCSKGHAGPSVYAALALKGFFPLEELKTLNQPGTNLPSHCDHRLTKGIDVTTGSLGQGLSVAAGIAYAQKLKGNDARVFCIVGDGELQEGQNWEAIMSTPHHNIDNLVLFIDSNKVQLDGAVADIANLEHLDSKFEAFNWNTIVVDGHNIDELKEAIENAEQCKGKPTAIVCNTVKGKGVVWAENEFNHHVNVSEEEAKVAIDALNAK